MKKETLLGMNAVGVVAVGSAALNCDDGFVVPLVLVIIGYGLYIYSLLKIKQHLK